MFRIAVRALRRSDGSLRNAMMAMMAASFAAARTPAQSFYFVERAAQVGISHTYSLPLQYYSRPMFSGGVAADFNRDGWTDLFVTAGGENGNLDKLYVNNGDGTFTNQAASWGVAASHLSVAPAVGDFNNDGWPDLYVTVLGVGTGAPGYHRLYRNNGDGSFTDIADAAGVRFASPTHGDGTGAAFGDYDLDGDLDLAVAGWFENSNGNRLFRNNGDSTFTDVTATAILRSMSGVRGFSPRFVDMNQDRYPELLWVSDFGTSVYLVNRGDGTFRDQTAEAGVGLESFGMGQTVGDFDNDGRLDWYVTSIFYDFPPPNVHQGNVLYRNLGDHVFDEIATNAGVVNGGWGWGTAAVDLDHDGLLDLIEVNGWNTIEWKFEPNYFFRNLGGLAFEEIAGHVGLDDAVDGRGVIHADFDRDGDEDVVVLPWREPLRYYRNELSGPASNWLRVRLDTSQRPDLAPDGFGCRITLHTASGPQVRHIDAGTNFQSQIEPMAHFGLGAQTVVSQVRVRWPDGQASLRHNVLANQTVLLTPPPRFADSAKTPLGALPIDR